MAQINVSANTAGPGGPNLVFNRALDVDAYDKIDVTVPASRLTREVDRPLGPVYLSPSLDWYGDDLKYKINNMGASSLSWISCFCFNRADAVSLFHTAPAKLSSQQYDRRTAEDAKGANADWNLPATP